MKLKYRGITYEPATVTTRPRGYIGEGKYRGITVKYPSFIADVFPPEIELTYRGVPYKTGKPRAAVSVASVPVVAVAKAENPSIDEQIRQLTMQHQRQIRKRERSMLLRKDAEIGLSVGAVTHLRNHIQGYTPFNELTDYERSHVAMS